MGPLFPGNMLVVHKCSRQQILRVNSNRPKNSLDSFGTGDSLSYMVVRMTEVEVDTPNGRPGFFSCTCYMESYR